MVWRSLVTVYLLFQGSSNRCKWWIRCRTVWIEWRIQTKDTQFSKQGAASHFATTLSHAATQTKDAIVCSTAKSSPQVGAIHRTIYVRLLPVPVAPASPWPTAKPESKPLFDFHRRPFVNYLTSNCNITFSLFISCWFQNSITTLFLTTKTNLFTTEIVFELLILQNWTLTKLKFRRLLRKVSYIL